MATMEPMPPIAVSATTKRWTMVAVILGSGIVFLDSTVVNVALPTIGQELHSRFFGVLEAQNYVYYAYLLSLSALLILAGALSDYYGRRRMFVIGLVGFGITSLLCGLAPDIDLLILFRILQGAAGAILVPGSLAIITATFQGQEQGRAFGLWAGASAATTILGPFIGGLLVQGVSWRAAFFLNLPLVLVALYATLVHMQESRDEDADPHFDWLGALVVALAVGGLAFGAIRGQEVSWQGSVPYISLAIGFAATIAFPILMARSKHPLVPLSLFRSRNFTVTNISTLVIYGALYVTFAFLVIYLQGTLGYNAAAAGLAGIIGDIPLALFSTRFGKLADRYGPRLFMALGPAIMAVGVFLFSRIPPTSEAWVFGSGPGQSLLPPSDYWTQVLPGFVIFGIGLMVMVAPLTTALMRSVPTERSGVASAVNNAISRVGPQLAGALIFVAISASFYSGLANRLPGVDTSSPTFREQVSPLNQPAPGVAQDVKAAAREESGSSFELGMLIAAGLLVFGAAVNGVGIRNPARADRPARAGPAEPVPEAQPAATAPLRPRAAADKPPPCQHGPVPVIIRSGASTGDEPDTS
jgi:EmrB/QacA subfamily drug resistance transporter